MMTRLTRIFAAPLLAVLLLSGSALGFQSSTEFDPHRTKLLGYMIRQQLATNHYNPKDLDDRFSKAAFDLHLKQLDFQKRFLLKKDVERLRSFSTRIDDEINSGEMELPAVSAQLLNERVTQAREMVRGLLTETFDLRQKDSMETDPEKLEYCATQQELRERWRKVLKLQIVNRYLNLLEDEESAAKEKDARPRSQTELLGLAREKVQKNFDELFTRLLEEPKQNYYDRYFDAVTRAFDPHTNYLPPTQKEDFDIGMSGSLEGIGATLREEDGYIKVVSVIPGSPAYQQGQLEPEDVILKVAERNGEPVDITDTRIRDAVSLIRGKKGTEVRLTVKKPDGRAVVIPITRDVVQIEDTFVRSLLLEETPAGPRYGYIHIPAFYRDFKSTRDGGTGRNSTDDVRAELTRLKAARVDGLVLDLRNNGGGALTDAVAIAGLFIETGPVVQVRGSDSRISVLADDDPAVEYAGPIVVLVNQFSASASEILAGALQDYGRAIIIGGAHTHGKGTVQAIIDLDRTVPFRNMDKYKPLGAIKLTTQKFYRISGGSTQYRGVIPDIVLPDRLDHLKSGEQYLDYSLPWDTVEATSFPVWAGAGSGVDLAQLRTRSRQRTEEGKGRFVEILTEARRAKERTEKTLQSLQLEDVRKERAEAKQLAEKSGPFEHSVAGGDADEAPEKRLSTEQRRQEWEKKVRQDPYTGEALAIIADVTSGKYALKTPRPAEVGKAAVK